MDQFPGVRESQDWFEQNIEGGLKKPENEDAKDVLSSRCCSDGTEDSNLGTFHRLRNASKPHSTPLTLKWLEENYEIAEGVCIPRSTLYYHYLDYCEKNDTQPVNAASFGKIIRQQFPQITTRRLGTRGQSKYHYYGIGVKETSVYYEVMYSAKGIQSTGEGKKDSTKQIVAYSPRSKLGTLLPEFPDLKEIKLPANVSEEKVLTFMMMYRTHCQRILDTVIRANFDEVQSFLLHFWQGMPQHMVPILDSQTIVMLVGVCDSILYKAIANVLMPTVLQALPDSLTQVIRRFAKQLDEWLRIALDSLPEGLQRIKFDLARRFAQVLRRQTSLNHLCQAARTVIHSVEITSQMLDDWLSIDLNSIIKQTLYTMDSYSDRDHDIIVNLCTEFENLLEEQAPLESYIEWLDSMVDRCVVKLSKKKPRSLRKIARQFLLMWSCFGTRVIRDMTLHSAPSFGSFHLMHLMFDDYVLYLVETLHSQERANDFLRHIKGEQTDDMTEEDILPDSSVIKETIVSSDGISAFSSTLMNRQNERDSVITRARDIIGNIAESDPPHMTSGGMTSSSATSSCDIMTGVNGNNMSADINESNNTYNTPITSEPLTHCSAFASPFNQGTHSNNENDQIFPTSYSNNQQQISVPPLFISAARNANEMNLSHDLNRYNGGFVDWSSPCAGFNQQDMQNVPRMEPIMYQQFPGIRQSGIDCNTYGYFDPQTSGRNFLSVGNDIAFQGMTQNCEQNSNLTNVAGKRTCDEASGKAYKRTNRSEFHIQDSYV